MRDKISVIIPVYNVKSYINQCFYSFLKQTYDNFEIIFVDDCSDDGSAEIILNLKNKYPQIVRLIKHAVRGNAAKARNTGILASEGEWLAFCDSDDWVSEDYLSSLYNAAAVTDADIAISTSIFYYYSDRKIKKVNTGFSLDSDSSHKEIVAFFRSNSGSKIFRKSFVTDSGILFPDDLWRGEDHGFVLPLVTKTEKIALIDKPMYYYRQRMDSNSNINFTDTDLSFYLKSIQTAEDSSNAGFETELEFRAVSELLYGMVMVMVRAGKSKEEIYEHIDFFNLRYPDWKKNQYLFGLNRAKRLFIYFADKKMYFMIKFLIFGWDMLNKFN